MFTFKKDARICLFVRIGRVKVERERVGRERVSGVEMSLMRGQNRVNKKSEQRKRGKVRVGTK